MDPGTPLRVGPCCLYPGSSLDVLRVRRKGLEQLDLEDTVIALVDCKGRSNKNTHLFQIGWRFFTTM